MKYKNNEPFVKVINPLQVKLYTKHGVKPTDIYYNKYTDKVVFVLAHLEVVVAGVLIALAACVAVETAQAGAYLVVKAEGLKQRFGALAELALKSRDARGHFLERFILGKPCLVALEHVLEVPSEFLRDFTALGDNVLCHINKPRFLSIG